MADIEKQNPNALVTSELIDDLRQIIDQARGHVAATANYELTMMNWNIGNRINRDVLNNERAEYGQQIVSQVATKLQEEYGTNGFEPRSIRRMMQFARLMPDSKIVPQVEGQMLPQVVAQLCSIPKASIPRLLFSSRGYLRESFLAVVR